MKLLDKLFNKSDSKNLKKDIFDPSENKNDELLNFIETFNVNDLKLQSPKIYKELVNQPKLHEKFISKMKEFFGYKYYRTMEELMDDYVLDDWETIKNVRMNKLNENHTDPNSPRINNKRDIIEKYELASELYILPVKTKIKEGTKQEHALGMLYPTPKAVDFFVDNNRYFFISLDIANIVWGTKSLSFLEAKNVGQSSDDFMDVSRKGGEDVYKILNFMETNRLSDLSFYQYDNYFYTFKGIRNLQNETYSNQVPINKAQNIIDNILIQINEDVKTKKPSIAGRIKTVLDTGIERSFRLRLTRQTKGHKGNLELARMVSIRRLAGAEMIHDLSSLGYDETSISIMKEALKFKNGLIIISGPTGKGKTTLLYSLLYYMNRVMNREIICVHQDTIEIEIDGFRQIDMSDYMNAKDENKMNIEEVIANILQQKPDVTLIDEVKRPDEMQKLVDLANKGHTTFTTMHTNDCASTLSVLENTGGVARDFYIQSVKLIVNQDLVKKKCRSCNGTGLDKLNMNNSDGARCEVCNGTGTSGVLPVYELAFFKNVVANDNPAVNFYKLVKEGKILLISKEQIAKNYLEQNMITQEDYELFAGQNIDNIEKLHQQYTNLHHQTTFETDNKFENNNLVDTTNKNENVVVEVQENVNLNDNLNNEIILENVVENEETRVIETI